MGRSQDATSAASPEPCAALFQSGRCRRGACERQPPRTFSLSSLKSNEGGQTHNHVNNNTWRSPIRGEERAPYVPGRAEAASQAEAGDAPGHTPGHSQPETGSAGLCVDPNVQRSISDIPEIAKNDRKPHPAPGGLGGPLSCPPWPPPPSGPCPLLEVASARRSEQSCSPPPKRDAQLARAVLSEAAIGIRASGAFPGRWGRAVPHLSVLTAALVAGQSGL